MSNIILRIAYLLSQKLLQCFWKWSISNIKLQLQSKENVGLLTAPGFLLWQKTLASHYQADYFPVDSGTLQLYLPWYI